MGRDRVEKVFGLIGARISGARIAKDITPNELAVRCGLKRPSIVLIEAGKQFVPIDGLYRIARALEIDITDLLPPVSEVFVAEGIGASTFILDEPSKGRLDDDSQRAIQSILKKHEGTNETKD
jgi:transcriptional regulator with XRE-family HTH domain